MTTVEHAAKRRRPDAGGHGHQVAIPEGVAQSSIVDEVADGEVEILAFVQQPRRQPVEAQDVVGHAQEGGPHEVAALGEVAGGRAANEKQEAQRFPAADLTAVGAIEPGIDRPTAESAGGYPTRWPLTEPRSITLPRASPKIRYLDCSDRETATD